MARERRRQQQEREWKDPMEKFTEAGGDSLGSTCLPLGTAVCSRKCERNPVQQLGGLNPVWGALEMGG